jgi:hypothetical protein
VEDSFQHDDWLKDQLHFNGKLHLLLFPHQDQFDISLVLLAERFIAEHVFDLYEFQTPQLGVLWAPPFHGVLNYLLVEYE